MPGKERGLWVVELAALLGLGVAAALLVVQQRQMCCGTADPRKVAAPAVPSAKAVGGPGAFGIACGGETFGDHARLFPLLHRAGVTMVRSFPEWANFQPKRGEWDFSAGDGLIDSARKNQIQIAGVFMYLAPWASSAPPGADHGARTRTFPIKDIAFWRDYVEGVVKRYHKDITYWEVYNEFNSPGFARSAKVEDYVAMVRCTYEAARKVDPKCKIGIGCADVDISFLERVIAGGAKGHFDFINVHPYSLMGAVMAGREKVFLRLAENLRKMLVKCKQPADLPLWVSEVGVASVDKPAPERRQAEAIVKAYVLCLAQGIDRVFWVEGRGPAYGPSGDFGILRKDWTQRPSYQTLQTLTGLLGSRPTRLGWLNPTGKSYGFVFRGPAGAVLATWAAGAKGDTLRPGADVTVIDLAGKATQVKADEPVALTAAPVFVTNLPAKWVADARANRDKPMGWLEDYSKAESVSCRMGVANVTSGVTQNEGGDGKTVLGTVDGEHVRRTDIAEKSLYVYFDVDDSYASVGDNELEITIVAQRVDDAKGGGCKICYESTQGYRTIDEWWTIPPGKGWHRHTFRVRDANFANNWGWNFRIDAVSSPGDFWVKEVVVKRIGPKK